MTRVGVSGATGYLGEEITRVLRESGHVVIEYVRVPVSSSQRLFAITDAGLEIGDTDDIELFIHGAWVLSGKAREAATLNTRATQQLLAALRKSDTQMIFISSMAAFPEAKSWYGRSKLDAERAVLEGGGIVVRPGTVFGGRNRGIVGAIDKVVRMFHVAPVFGGRNTRLYLVRVERLCAILNVIACAPSRWTGQVLSIFDSPQRSLADLYRTLARNANTWVVCINIPAAPCVAILRFCEWVGLRLPLRSDSIVSITNTNPHSPTGIPDQLARLVDGESSAV
jgi:nucleoside-diphosphate-sugar epimerase